MKRLWILPISLVVSASAFSADPSAAPTPTWEFDGATNAGLSISDPGDSSSSTTVFGGAVGAGYFFLPALEGNLTASYFHTSTSTRDSHSFTALAGPTVNLGTDAENAFFVGGAVGVESATLTSDSFTWTVFAGRRIRLADHVSWAPDASYLSGVTKDWMFSVFRVAILL